MTKDAKASIKKKIETIMISRGKTRFFSLGFLLFVFSLFYGGAVRLREILYRRGVLRSERFSCMVVSVGNLTVGGTGKTPMTMYFAKLVQRYGYKTVVISRGYKGKAEKKGGIVSDGQTIQMNSSSAGDEPFMMATGLKNIPVIVGKNRCKAAMLSIKKFKPDILILDDAFQHLKVERDLDILLLDHSLPFGNNYLFPRGTLREPISALARADVCILTRSDSKKSTFFTKQSHLLRKKPVFMSFHNPVIHKVVIGRDTTVIDDSTTEPTYDFKFLKGLKVFVFSGLARNDDFLNTVEKLNCDVKGFLSYPDHHFYSEADFSKILQSAKNAGAEALITTEKDYARIAHRATWPIDLIVIGIEISLGDTSDTFNAFIKTRLEKFNRRKGVYL